MLRPCILQDRHCPLREHDGPEALPAPRPCEPATSSVPPPSSRTWADNGSYRRTVPRRYRARLGSSALQPPWARNPSYVPPFAVGFLLGVAVTGTLTFLVL